MSKCIISSCKNRGTTANGTLTLPPGVSFHRLPTDPYLLDKWKSALHITRPTNPREFVCSSHFRLEDFREGLLMRRLLNTAVPSLDTINNALPVDKRKTISHTRATNTKIEYDSCEAQLTDSEMTLDSDHADDDVQESAEFVDQAVEQPLFQATEQIQTSEVDITDAFEITYEEILASDILGSDEMVSDNPLDIPSADTAPVLNVIVRSKEMLAPQLPTLPPIQCRVCSFESPLNERLFDERGALTSAGKSLFKLIRVNLCPGDGFPTRICRPCHMQLKICAAFQDSALQMQVRFEKTLATIRKSQMPFDSLSVNRCRPVVSNRSDWEQSIDTNQDDVPCDAQLADFSNESTRGDNDDDIDADPSYTHDQPSKLAGRQSGKLRMVRARPWIGPKLCPHCEQEFHEQQPFIDHIKECVPKRSKNRPASACGECGVTFSTFKQAENHKCGAMPVKTKDMLWCPVCQKDVTKAQYENHRVRHSTLRPFECTKCPKTFKFNADLRMHMIRHTNIRRFVCEVCGAAFRQLSHYREHQEMHSGQVLTCTYAGCVNQFRTRKALYNHCMAKHERKIVCPICDLGLCNNFRLKAHMKVHERDGRIRTIREVAPTDVDGQRED